MRQEKRPVFRDREQPPDPSLVYGGAPQTPLHQRELCNLTRDPRSRRDRMYHIPSSSQPHVDFAEKHKEMMLKPRRVRGHLLPGDSRAHSSHHTS